MWGTETDGYFAVGRDGLLIRGAGDDWEKIDCGVTSNLTTVWGFSDSDVYVGGWEGTLLHFDGTVWHQVEGLEDKIVTALWGTGPESMYIAAQGIIHHFDGDELSPQEMDEFYSDWGMRAFLNSIHGTHEENVLCVGGDFNSGIVFALENEYWAAQWSGVKQILRDVFTYGDGVDFALDRYGRLLANDSGIWYDRTPPDLDFAGCALWGTQQSGLYVVGFDGGVWRYVE